jgi:hypothetical protein
MACGNFFGNIFEKALSTRSPWLGEEAKRRPSRNALGLCPSYPSNSNGVATRSFASLYRQKNSPAAKLGRAPRSVNTVQW